MPSFKVEDWKKKRMKAAEGSGVAKAITAFDKAWKDKPADFDFKSHQAACSAVGTFKAALKKAMGKCAAAKKEDPAGYKTTIDLIDAWETELEKCDHVLVESATRLNKQAEDEQAAREAAEQHAEIRKKVFAEFSKKWDSVEQSIKNARTDLADFESAVMKKDLDECYKKQGPLAKTLHGLPFGWSDAGVKQEIGYAAAKLKCADDVVTIKECKPKKASKWKALVVAMAKTLDGLEDRMEEIEKQTDLADPKDAAGDPEYRANLAGLVTDYKEILGVVQTASERVKKLGAATRTLVTTREKLEPDKALGIRDTLVTKLDEAQDEMETALARSRTASGDVRKRKDDLIKAGKGITGGDNTKYLMPLLNRSYSLNVRTRRSVGELQEMLAELFPA